MRRSTRSLLTIAVVIAVMGLAVWLLLHENFPSLIQSLRQADRALIALAIATYFLSVLVWAYRWRIALASVGCHPRFTDLGPIILSAVFLNNMTPMMRLGGDPLGRVYLLQRTANTPYAATLAASIGEHAFAPLFTVLLLTGGFTLQFSQSSPVLAALTLMAGCSIAIALALGPRCFFRARVGAKRLGAALGRTCNWIWKRADKDRIVRGVEAFYGGFYTTIDTRKKGLQIGSLTALIWTMDVFRFYLIFLSLDYQPTLGILLLASSLPVVMGLIPFLPGGLVIVEGSLFAIFVAYGIPVDIAVAVTIIERGISYVFSSIVGGITFSFVGWRSARYQSVQG